MCDDVTIPNLPSLADLRGELVRGLARALGPSAGGELDEAAAKQAVDGHGLPETVRERFGESPVAALVCFDADQIQSWVFASERIQVAAGASQLLEELNEKAWELLAADRELAAHLGGKVFSAGGAGILLASASFLGNEKALASRMEELLRQRCPDLGFTVAAVPLHVRDFERSGDGDTLARVHGLGRFRVATGLKAALTRLQVEVRAKKDGQPEPSRGRLLRATNELLATRCPSCGARSPENPAPAGQEPKPANWCWWCRKVSGALRHGPRAFVDAAGNPITFADLAELVRQPRRYLGFLALDGNGMGQLGRQMGSLLELAAFSAATTAIYERARRAGIAALGDFAESPDETHLSLVGGGDEITFVLPAGAAPGVAQAGATAVEEGFDALTREDAWLARAFAENPGALAELRKAGAGAGLVLADGHFPVRFLRRYAAALQKRAKRHCNQTGERSAVAWELLATGSPLTEEPGEVAAASLGLARLADQLADVDHARAAHLPPSALQTVLRYAATEERALAGLGDEAERRNVHARLTANFFRYQLARNAPLASWWAAAERPEPGGEALVAWFADGGVDHLARLLDLLSLVPTDLAREAP